MSIIFALHAALDRRWRPARRYWPSGGATFMRSGLPLLSRIRRLVLVLSRPAKGAAFVEGAAPNLSRSEPPFPAQAFEAALDKLVAVALAEAEARHGKALAAARVDGQRAGVAAERARITAIMDDEANASLSIAWALAKTGETSLEQARRTFALIQESNALDPAMLERRQTEFLQ